MRTPTAQMTWPKSESTACNNCLLKTRCFIATRLPDEDGDCAGIVRRRYPLAYGDRLYRRNAQFSSLYQVCSGSLKTQRETRDGRLVVTGFFLPGDIVGIEAIGDRRYPGDAIATTAAEVCQLDVEQLLARCATKPGVHAWMISQIGHYVRRKDGDHVLANALPAHLRVLRFFLDLYERLTDSPPSNQPSFLLPMRKQDIAHYLSITPETLSRNLALLRRQGLLHVDYVRFSMPDTSRAKHLTRL